MEQKVTFTELQLLYKVIYIHLILIAVFLMEKETDPKTDHVACWLIFISLLYLSMFCYTRCGRIYSHLKSSTLWFKA